MICVVAGCSKESGNDKNSNQTTEKTTKKREKVMVDELRIPNGEREVYGKLYYPETEGKYPAIIMCHGYNGSNADFIKECKYFAKHGYVAFSLDFCGGSTRSLSSGKSTDMTIFTEKEDLLAVFDYILTLPQVDPENVYMFGGSQGGLVAALAAEERVEKVKGLALYFPAFNIPDNWRGNFAKEEDIPATYDFWGLTLGRNFFVSMRDFYTFDNIGKFDKKVLIVQGDNDAIVPVDSSRRAVEIYKDAKMEVLTGEGHGFSPTGAGKAMKMVLDFMDGK